MGIVAILMVMGIALCFYIFYCYCCKLICEKTGKDPGVLIWIPIANLIPLLEVAKLPTWMIILFFVPLVNFAMGLVMWAKVCEARGKSPWLVVLMLVPVVNLFLIPYLAFSE
jgi:hypothetical protein